MDKEVLLEHLKDANLSHAHSKGQKNGPFSVKDKEYIEKNYGDKTIDEIAEHLKRNPVSIGVYIRKNKIEPIERINIPSTAQDKVTKQIDVLKSLRSRPFYKNLKKQFSEEELDLFCDYWVLTVMDFDGNIMSHEELELKEWLTFQILKDRLLTQHRVNLLKRDQLKEEMKDLLKIPKAERDSTEKTWIMAEIEICNSEIASYNKEFADLVVKAEKIKNGLVKSREQRTKDLDSSKVDFVSWLKTIQEREARRRTGEEMELFKMAEAKKRESMYEYMEYADGTLDIPILNSESIKDKKDA